MEPIVIPGKSKGLLFLIKRIQWSIGNIMCPIDQLDAVFLAPRYHLLQHLEPISTVAVILEYMVSTLASNIAFTRVVAYLSSAEAYQDVILIC